MDNHLRSGNWNVCLLRDWRKGWHVSVGNVIIEFTGKITFATLVIVSAASHSVLGGFGGIPNDKVWWFIPIFIG